MTITSNRQGSEGVPLPGVMIDDFEATKQRVGSIEPLKLSLEEILKDFLSNPEKYDSINENKKLKEENEMLKKENRRLEKRINECEREKSKVVFEMNQLAYSSEQLEKSLAKFIHPPPEVLPQAYAPVSQARYTQMYYPANTTDPLHAYLLPEPAPKEEDERQIQLALKLVDEMVIDAQGNTTINAAFQAEGPDIPATTPATAHTSTKISKVVLEPIAEGPHSPGYATACVLKMHFGNQVKGGPD